MRKNVVNTAKVAQKNVEIDAKVARKNVVGLYIEKSPDDVHYFDSIGGFFSQCDIPCITLFGLLRLLWLNPNHVSGHQPSTVSAILPDYPHPCAALRQDLTDALSCSISLVLGTF